MTQVVYASRGTKSGEVIAFEEDKGYSRDKGTVTVSAAMEVGAVLRDNAGTWEQVVAADVATIGSDDLAVLVDDAVYALKGTVTLPDDITLGVLVREAKVAKQALSFGDALSSAQKNSVVAQLATQGILAVDRI